MIKFCPILFRCDFRKDKDGNIFTRICRKPAIYIRKGNTRDTGMLCLLMNPKSRKTVCEEVIRVNLVTSAAVAYGSILLGVGRNTKSGGIITSVAGIIIGIFS